MHFSKYQKIQIIKPNHRKRITENIKLNPNPLSIRPHTLRLFRTPADIWLPFPNSRSAAQSTDTHTHMLISQKASANGSNEGNVESKFGELAFQKLVCRLTPAVRHNNLGTLVLRRRLHLTHILYGLLFWGSQTVGRVHCEGNSALLMWFFEWLFPGGFGVDVRHVMIAWCG